EHQKKETGIFDFLKHLPDAIIKKTPFSFMTVSEIADNFQPVAPLHVPSPISWADEERDLTAWMGNELQTAAVSKLYSLAERVDRCGSEQLTRDWVYNPYENPYQAFMNYMNVLSDFEIRLNVVCPVNDHYEEVNRLSASIEARDMLINELQGKLVKLEKKAGVARPKAVKGKVKKTAAVKTAAVKTVAVKTAAVKAVAARKAPKKTATKKGAAKKK
nr:alpha-amylase [Bacteroidales bacterium]